MAKQRCFTNYLPGFNIPMLPRELSDELCNTYNEDVESEIIKQIKAIKDFKYFVEKNKFNVHSMKLDMEIEASAHCKKSGFWSCNSLWQSGGSLKREKKKEK